MAIAKGLAHYNDKFLVLAEHYDDFVIDAALKNPNIWHDRILRGGYKPFSGLEQKTNIYRGGLPVQAGLSTWNKISQSRKPNGDPGFDNCAPGTPQRYSYAWETITYEGYQDEWQSDPLCVADLTFVDYAKEQLALVIKTGVDYGISMLENWNREMYVYQALLSQRAMVMSSGALAFEDEAKYRFEYDPFVNTTDVDGALVPYLTFDPNLEISTLNWDFLDYLSTTLAARQTGAALTNISGLPVFGLMLDMMDFERMIKSDPELRDDWRNAQAQKLIEGYNMGMKQYRGYALIHDMRQMRFRVKGIDASTGKVIATRVTPLRGGRAVTFGQVPEPNPDYYRAEIGLGIIFMNDVLMNLFVPSIDSLGSGTHFGPAPGLTGQWQWINNKGYDSNVLGEEGYFYGRFRLFPKPLLASSDATVFIYRRCPQAPRTLCNVELRTDVASGAVAPVADAAEADFDATNRRITLTLAKLLPAGVGSTVTIKKADDSNKTFQAKVLNDADAPKYTFGWASGATNAPAAHTSFTAAGSTVTA